MKIVLIVVEFILGVVLTLSKNVLSIIVSVSCNCFLFAQPVNVDRMKMIIISIEKYLIN